MMMLKCLLVTSILATGHPWVLTSTHTNVLPHLTDDVTLHCFHQGPNDGSQTINLITRIRLLKMDDNKEWNEYARIVLPNTSLVKLTRPNVPSILTSGYLGKVDESFLSVTWSTSSEDTVGSYRCAVDGFGVGNGNNVHVTTTMVNLTHEDVSTKDLLDLIVHMRNKSNQLSEELRSLKKESLAQYDKLTNDVNSQVSNWSNTLTQEINSVKEDSLAQYEQLTDDVNSQVSNWSNTLTQEINSLKEESLAQHHNLTTSIKKEVHSDIIENYFELRHWPIGNFSMLSTNDGCPDTFTSKFESGYSQYQTETSRRPRHNFTSARNLRGEVFERCGARNVLKFHFCVADIREYRSLWPKGTYCISYGRSSCPEGFHYGHTSLYLESSRDLIGTDFYSTMNYSPPSHSIYFLLCCRKDGRADTPILLPNTSPFYLYRFKGRCQKVFGTEFKEQTMYIDTDDGKKDNYYNEYHADGTLNDASIKLCYYFKKP